MLKSQVKVGAVYTAMVSGKDCFVRIDREYRSPFSNRTGWEATNLMTGRSIRIKSAQKLKREVSEDVAQEAIAKMEGRKLLP